MSLIKCKECGVEVSSKAETCPKCGVRVARKPMGCGKAFLLFIVGSIAIVWISSASGTKASTPTALPSQSVTLPSVATSVTAIPTPPPAPGSQWQYDQSQDEMGGGSVSSAVVVSTNTVNFGFPYAGEQHAVLILRSHPRHGKDVILRIEKGQILCHSYDGCNVLVRFDEEKPIQFSAAGPADNSTELIFIRNYGRFYEKMLKANLVRISVNVYQEGAPIFEFNVSGFNAARYRAK